jgi:acetolactate synthase-1/2/3 large subunit
VLVDDRLGVIEANERRMFGRAFATEFGNPDFVALAKSFGIAGFAVQGAEELEPTLHRALDAREPAVVAVPIDAAQNDRIASEGE